jgi:hypothetical protein
VYEPPRRVVCVFVWLAGEGFAELMASLAEGFEAPREAAGAVSAIRSGEGHTCAATLRRCCSQYLAHLDAKKQPRPFTVGTARPGVELGLS